MNRFYLFLVTIMLAALFITAGCAQEETKDPGKDNTTADVVDDSAAVEPEIVEPEPVDTAPVAAEIDVSFLQDYNNWELAKADVTSPAHMNAIKDVYVNSIGIDAFKSGTVPFPAGTIITKENYADESGTKGSLMALTCMIKMEAGYDPDNGDWAYVNTGADGVAQETGKLTMCIECHTQVKDKDYVYLGGNQ